jgi:hypothetical protein
MNANSLQSKSACASRCQSVSVGPIQTRQMNPIDRAVEGTTPGTVAQHLLHRRPADGRVEPARDHQHEITRRFPVEATAIYPPEQVVLGVGLAPFGPVVARLTERRREHNPPV